MLELLLVLEPLLGVECLSGAGPDYENLFLLGLPLLLLQDSHSLHPVAELPCQELLVPEHVLSFPPLF